MNLSLLQKHIEKSYFPDINPHLLEDRSNISEFYCADVVGYKRFAQNFGGWPRSEIAQINAEANLQVQMNLLNDMIDYTPSSNPNAGLSDAEIMLSHKSKYLQCATEMQGWLVEQLKVRDARIEAQKIKDGEPPRDGADKDGKPLREGAKDGEESE